VLDLSQGTAIESSTEEGEDDVKSAWCLCPGRHTSYNGEDNRLPNRKVELILQTSPQFGLGAEIRPHEVGIGSNRRSADSGEYVLRSCTNKLRLPVKFSSRLKSCR
jgi:hypothetical protein